MVKPSESKIKKLMKLGLDSKSIETMRKALREDELRNEYEKLPPHDTENWHQVGEVGVDAGMVWLGDPCYILPDTRFGRDGSPKFTYNQLCDKLDEDDEYKFHNEKFFKKHIKLGRKHVQKATQFNYEAGHPGLGVCVPSGDGDGSYPVLVKYNKEGRIKEVKIVFIENEENENESI